MPRSRSKSTQRSPRSRRSNRALLITRHDCVAAIRGTRRRLEEHAFTTIFAILLMIPFMVSITYVSIFVLTEETVFSDMIAPGDFLATIYVIVAGRSLATTLHLVYKEPSTEVLRIIPVPTEKVYLGKLFTVIALTMMTFSLFFAPFLFFFLAIYEDPVTITSLLTYSGYIYLIAFFGILSGFVLPLIFYLPSNLRYRILFVLAPTIGAGGTIISVTDLGTTLGTLPGGLLFPVLLMFFCVILFGIIVNMSWYYNEAVMTYLPGSDTERHQVPRLVALTRIIEKGTLPRAHNRFDRAAHSRIVAAKELLATLRDAYFHIYAGMTLIMTVIGVFIILTIPQEFIDSGWGWLVMPTVVSFMLFIEGAFMVTLGSLSLIGKEGKRLWVLRSLPVSGYEVLHGKAVSVIIPSVLGGYALAIPLLYISELPLGQNLVFLVLTLSIIFSFSGIGILAGVKYPNFTEGARGSPDIVFQMFILFVCLVFFGFIIVPPMTFYYNFGTLAGLIVSFMVLIFSYAVLVNGVRTGEKIFDRLSSEEYEAA